jgi:hypothetical protein
MHPDFLRELNSQRGREMRQRAHETALARMLRAARRGTKATDETDEFVVPAIPDYVDGSFRTTPADDTPSRVTAGRHAA